MQGLCLQSFMGRMKPVIHDANSEGIQRQVGSPETRWVLHSTTDCEAEEAELTKVAQVWVGAIDQLCLVYPQRDIQN